MSNNVLNREQWLNDVGEHILYEILDPIEPLRGDLKVNYSVGPIPGKSLETDIIGVCMPSSMSSDLINEIYVTPMIDDSLLVATVLVHELIHAMDDCKSQHRGWFVRIAKAAGLIAPYACAKAGPELTERLNDLIKVYGPIPHSKISYAGRKRQKGRNRRVWCESCDFKFATSASQITRVIENIGCISCPNCANEMKYQLEA